MSPEHLRDGEDDGHSTNRSPALFTTEPPDGSRVVDIVEARITPDMSAGAVRDALLKDMSDPSLRQRWPLNWCDSMNGAMLVRLHKQKKLAGAFEILGLERMETYLLVSAAEALCEQFLSQPPDPQTPRATDSGPSSAASASTEMVKVVGAFGSTDPALSMEGSTVNINSRCRQLLDDARQITASVSVDDTMLPNSRLGVFEAVVEEIDSRRVVLRCEEFPGDVCSGQPTPVATLDCQGILLADLQKQTRPILNSLLGDDACMLFDVTVKAIEGRLRITSCKLLEEVPALLQREAGLRLALSVARRVRAAASATSRNTFHGQINEICGDDMLFALGTSGGDVVSHVIIVVQPNEIYDAAFIVAVRRALWDVSQIQSSVMLLEQAVEWLRSGYVLSAIVVAPSALAYYELSDLSEAVDGNDRVPVIPQLRSFTVDCSSAPPLQMATNKMPLNARETRLVVAGGVLITAECPIESNAVAEDVVAAHDSIVSIVTPLSGGGASLTMDTRQFVELQTSTIMSNSEGAEFAEGYCKHEFSKMLDGTFGVCLSKEDLARLVGRSKGGSTQTLYKENKRLPYVAVDGAKKPSVLRLLVRLATLIKFLPTAPLALIHEACVLSLRLGRRLQPVSGSSRTSRPSGDVGRRWQKNKPEKGFLEALIKIMLERGADISIAQTLLVRSSLVVAAIPQVTAPPQKRRLREGRAVAATRRTRAEICAIRAGRGSRAPTCSGGICTRRAYASTTTWRSLNRSSAAGCLVRTVARPPSSRSAPAERNRYAPVLALPRPSRRRRQHANAAKIIENGLRLSELGRAAGAKSPSGPGPLSETTSATVVHSV